MSPARIWLCIFAAGYAVVATLFVATLLTPPYRGDLTRIGQLSETRFGPRESSSDTLREVAPDTPLAQADLLVIGDSFSVPRAWQIHLTRRGSTIAFLHWNELGPLCADLHERLAARGFRGRWVIVQTIERELIERVDESARCTHMRTPRQAAPAPVAASAKLWPHLNWGETLLTGVVNAWRTQRALQTEHELFFENTRVVPLPQGCRLFSHAACSKGLFYAADHRRAAASFAQLDQMQAIARRPAPWRMMWMVMPDKSSIYLASDRNRVLVEGLQARCLGPDLYTPLIAARDSTVDLYRPNDTHFGPQGYAIVGAATQRALSDMPSCMPSTSRP